jgi:hypothetical protein
MSLVTPNLATLRLRWESEPDLCLIQSEREDVSWWKDTELRILAARLSLKWIRAQNAHSTDEEKHANWLKRRYVSKFSKV